MAQFTRTFDHRLGPILEARIEPVLEVQKIWRAKHGTVPSASVTMLIDTGASATLIQSEVFAHLGFEPFTYAFLRTPSTTTPLLRGKYRG